VNRELLELLENLRSQLSRRREDQSACSAAPLLDELVKDGEKERCRLSAAGLRTSEKVFAGERGWNGVGLDWRRSMEAKLLDAAEEVAVKMKRSEGHELRIEVRLR
jgi:hypothetical protein